MIKSTFERVNKVLLNRTFFLVSATLILSQVVSPVFAQDDKPVKFSVQMEGEFKVDSTVAKIIDQYRVYGNENDRSDFYFSLGSDYHISTIGWFWVKLLGQNNVTLDTLKGVSDFKIIRSLTPVDDDIISVSCLGGAFSIHTKDGKFDKNSTNLFLPEKGNKKYKKDDNWMAYLSPTDTVVIAKSINKKKSPWEFIIYKDGVERVLYTTCEMDSQFPISTRDYSLVLNEQNLQVAIPECKSYLIHDFNKSLTSIIKFPEQEDHLLQRSIYYDKVNNSYYSLSRYTKSKFLFEIQELTIDQTQFRPTGDNYTLLITDLFGITGIHDESVKLRSFSASETVHYSIPLNKLQELNNEIIYLKEIEVNNEKN